MSRLTHLDVSAYSIGGTSYLGNFKATTFDIDPTVVEGKAVSQRHDRGVVTKRKLTFKTDELLTATSVRKTNLDVTVFTVGGTGYLGRLKSGSIKVTSTTKDGSGIADEWESPVCVATGYEISGTFQIASTADFMALAGGARAGLNAVVSVSLGGTTFTAPMVLSKASHKIDVDDLQIEDVTFTAGGLPTAASGNAVLASVALGTAEMAFAATTGAIGYAGTAIATETNLQFADGQILSASHSFACEGAPTITTPS